ncbi:SPBc2 prophage-derived glycosyltransferase SunS [compost metagenome]
MPCVIHHYGYLNAVVTDKKKYHRNMTMLKKERLLPAYSPWVDYHMASEYYREKEYKKAFEQLNISIQRFIDIGQIPPSIIYKLKYDTLLALGSIEGAWLGIDKAIALYPDYVDLHFYKGVILFVKEQYEEAEAVFQHCLILGEDNLQYLILKGSGSFLPLHFIGRCKEAKGDRKGAVDFYTDTLKLYPDHTETKLFLEPLLKAAHIGGKEASMITISLCVIARNEEESLGRCLSSVKDIADEIIVVDTGSTDQTKAVAAQFTTHIIDFTWIDHFAAARNFAFSQATQEYILWLDADDVFDEQDRQLFMELKKTLSPHVDSVTMSYHLAFDSKGNATSSLRRNRLVRRDRNFQWIGPVHEYLEVGGHIFHSDIAVKHRKERAYTDRNLRIYRKRQALGENFSPRDLYYFANELKDHKIYDEAVEYYEKFLATKQGWVEDIIQACLKLADCYAALLKTDKQIQALCYTLAYDTPRPEFCCKMGGFYLDSHQYEKAIFWFELATKVEIPPSMMGMVNRYASTWFPHLQLCLCYDRLGQIEKAFYHNEAALEFEPTHPSMLYNQAYFQKKFEAEKEA